MRIYQEEDKLMIAEGKSKVVIEPWGANSLRVRMTAEPKMDENDWALTEKVEKVPIEISFETIDVTDPWYKGEKGFYEGLKAEGETEIMSLVRCAWAGSQKYGVLTWSGDIYSSFRSMREQLQAGLNMGMAGIPWWTSDIGGFLGGNIKDPDFQELLVRWFAWGAFCPVFRMHGERSPWYEREQEFRNGVRQLTSGQDNEVWSFGEENYEILTKYLFIRERLRPYIRECMKTASETGAPVMRPLFFDFPEDKESWEIEDSYMFGPDLLVSPVMEAGATTRTIYLPKGASWTDAYTKKVYEGGQMVTVPAPIDIIPVMIKDGKEYPIYE